MGIISALFYLSCLAIRCFYYFFLLLTYLLKYLLVFKLKSVCVIWCIFMYMPQVGCTHAVALLRIMVELTLPFAPSLEN